MQGLDVASEPPGSHSVKKGSPARTAGSEPATHLKSLSVLCRLTYAPITLGGTYYSSHFVQTGRRHGDQPSHPPSSRKGRAWACRRLRLQPELLAGPCPASQEDGIFRSAGGRLSYLKFSSSLGKVAHTVKLID